MFNFLLLIFCAVAAVHSEINVVDPEECRDDDSTYSFKGEMRVLFAYLKPNNKAHLFQDYCMAEDSVIPTTSGECVQRLINFCAYNNVNDKPDLPVVGVVDTRLVERKQLTPYEVIKSSSTYVENNSDLQQEGQTAEYSEQTTSAYEFSMEQKVGITASAAFGIPLIGETKFEITTEFSFGEKYTNSESKTVTFPSQKVSIPPKSRIRLTFDVLLAKFDTKYASSFVLDKEHELIKKCIDKVSSPFLHLYLDKDGMVDATTATFTATQQTLNSLPISYVSEKHEIRVYISEAEPITTVIDDKSIPIISVFNLTSTNIFNTN